MRLALVQVPPRGLWGKSAQAAVDDGGGVARAAARRRPVARRRGAPLSRRVRARVGGGRDDVVPADRPARRWSSGCGRSSSRSETSGAASSSTSPRHRGRVRTHRRPCASSPSTTTSCSRTTTAAVSSRHPIARCSDRCGRSAGARCSTTGVVRGRWRAEPGGLVVRHVPLAKRSLAAIAAEGRRLARFLELERRRAARARQPVRPAPRRVSASAPRSEANASASGISIPWASANVSPAAKQSPAPYASSNGPGRDGRLVGPARLGPAPERTGGGDDEARRRIEVAGLVALGVVLAARDERVELDPGRVQRRQLPGGRDEHARTPRLAHRLGVAGGEVDAVDAVELLPRQRALAARRARLVPDHRDRPLPHVVHVTEAAPLRLVAAGRVDADAGRLQPDPALRAEVVAAQQAVERGAAGEPRQLHRRDAAAAGGLRPDLGRADDLARLGDGLDADELDPLHVPDDGHVHGGALSQMRPRPR